MTLFSFATFDHWLSAGLSPSSNFALLGKRYFRLAQTKYFHAIHTQKPRAASLFVNPVVKYILTSAGNIPVERKSSDRQTLFQGTFHALADGQAVALFPEGTSYTEPRIMQVKDGAAWAALEYTKWVREHQDRVRASEPVMIVPAAIVYTNKSKYRSRVRQYPLAVAFSSPNVSFDRSSWSKRQARLPSLCVSFDCFYPRFGKPIRMDEFWGQFSIGGEDEPRAAVKCLTASIERELIASTVNAPDWYVIELQRHRILVIVLQGYIVCRTYGKGSFMGLGALDITRRFRPYLTDVCFFDLSIEI